MAKRVVFDFDGVIHSYTSGWLGNAVIPDPPVPRVADVIRELREKGYEVVVVSTRCETPSGISAIEEYLKLHNIVVDDIRMTKPPAVCYVDDRAIRFDGDASNLLDQILTFKNWVDMVRKWDKEYTVKVPLRCSECPFYCDKESIICDLGVVTSTDNTVPDACLLPSIVEKLKVRGEE